MRDNGNKRETKGCVHLRCRDVQRRRGWKAGWFKRAPQGILETFPPTSPSSLSGPLSVAEDKSLVLVWTGARQIDNVKVGTAAVRKQRELQVSYCACCFPERLQLSRPVAHKTDHNIISQNTLLYCTFLTNLLSFLQHSQHFYFDCVTGGPSVWPKSLRSTGFSKWPHDKSNEHFFISSCLIVYWSHPWRNDYIISSVWPVSSWTTQTCYVTDI